MQNRTLPQTIFRPTENNGQRLAIGAASVRSAALELHKPYQIVATKICWVLVGGAAVVAVAGGANASFPLSAGGAYEYIPTGTNDRFVAVIEDPNFADAGNFLFIGEAGE